MYFGYKIIEDENMVEEYCETVKFKAHPIICWLSRHFNIDPWVYATYTRRRPKDEVYIVGKNTIICHPAVARQLRAQTSMKYVAPFGLVRPDPHAVVKVTEVS